MKIDKLLMLGYPSKYHQGDQHQAGTVERPMVEREVEVKWSPKHGERLLTI